MAQDMAVEILYSVFPRCVVHGGTAIWRCYSGNRFSEDVDFYVERDVERIARFFEMLERRGFRVLRRRVGRNALCATLGFGGAEIRMEAVFKRVKGVIKEFETYEGNLLNVYTLSPEAMVHEKNRCLPEEEKNSGPVRYFFPPEVGEKGRKAEIEAPDPSPELQTAGGWGRKTLLLFGAIPSTRDMLEYIKGWVG